MRLLITIILLLQAATSFGVDFTRLSSEEPITTGYPAEFKCYVDVSLSVNAAGVYSNPIFLRVSYIIGADTLNDNIRVDGTIDKVVKQFFLDEGERLTAIIHLNNGETKEINGIQGSLRIVRNPDFKPTNAHGNNIFLSGVWKSDQTPLFRVSTHNSTPQAFRLKLSLNENYEFDRLYLKMKVISPSAGIIMLDKEVVVTEHSEQEMRKKTFSIAVDEVDLSAPGTYYFQVMHNMATTRINGIEKIGYEIVPQ